MSGTTYPVPAGLDGRKQVDRPVHDSCDLPAETAAPSRGLREAIASTRLCFLGSGAAASAFEAARHASWWIGILFAAASLCFLVAPMPWFFDAVRARTDAMVFSSARCSSRPLRRCSG